MKLPFVSDLSFFDPPLTPDGKDYKTERYKDIIKERFLISKHIHTSYQDTSYISPLERMYLLQLIMEDLQKKQEITEQIIGKNR